MRFSELFYRKNDNTAQILQEKFRWHESLSAPVLSADWRQICGSGDCYDLGFLKETRRLMPPSAELWQKYPRRIVFLRGYSCLFVLPMNYRASVLLIGNSAGIVHRDIKLENIILQGGEDVLIDFDAFRFRKPKGARSTFCWLSTSAAF